MLFEITSTSFFSTNFQARDWCYEILCKTSFSLSPALFIRGFCKEIVLESFIFWTNSAYLCLKNYIIITSRDNMQAKDYHGRKNDKSITGLPAQLKVWIYIIASFSFFGLNLHVLCTSLSKKSLFFHVARNRRVLKVCCKYSEPWYSLEPQAKSLCRCIWIIYFEGFLAIYSS